MERQFPFNQKVLRILFSIFKLQRTAITILVDFVVLENVNTSIYNHVRI